MQFFFLEQISDKSTLYYFWLYSAPVHVSYIDLYVINVLLLK